MRRGLFKQFSTDLCFVQREEKKRKREEISSRSKRNGAQQKQTSSVLRGYAFQTGLHFLTTQVVGCARSHVRPFLRNQPQAKAGKRKRQQQQQQQQQQPQGKKTVQIAPDGALTRASHAISLLRTDPAVLFRNFTFARRALVYAGVHFERLPDQSLPSHSTFFKSLLNVFPLSLSPSFKNIYLNSH